MSRCIGTTLAASVLAISTLSARAATNYFDGNDINPGFGIAGGTWGVQNMWTTDPTGVAVPSKTDTTTADDLHFGTDSNGLATGTITIVGTNQGFRTMSFGAASGQIRTSGGPLSLAATGSKIYANNFSNRIDSVLTGNGGLNKFGTQTHTAFLTTNAATILPNTSLADYHAVDGVMGGASIGGGGDARAADPYFFTHNGTNASCQFQILDGQWTKCVKVELTQVGADVQGRVLYAKYINNGRQLGIDFDTVTNVLDQAVATSFGTAGYGAAETILTTDAIYSHFLPPNPAGMIVAPNASLADFGGVEGSVAGNSISGRETPGSVYFFTHNGTNATYQLQCENGGYTKCVKIELTQNGPDIVGAVLYAKYTASGNLGYDFDTGGTVNNIATSYTAGGYGAVKTRLLFNYGNTYLTLTGTNTYSGSTLIGNGILELAGTGGLGNGSYTNTIFNAGGLLYNSSAHQALGGTISGTGAVMKGIRNPFSSLTYASFLTADATTIFTNATLSDYAGADAVMGGASIYFTRPFVADTYHFTNDGATATFQLQIYDGGHTKCVKVELTQVDTNIAGRVLYAKYLGSQDSRGFDFDTGGIGGTIATSYAATGYGAAETTLLTYPNAKLTLSAANSYKGGTTVFRGVLEATGSASALPSNGDLRVTEGGELRLNVPGMPAGHAGGVGYGRPIAVCGGTLTLSARFNAGYSRPITLDGGTLRSMDTAWDNGDNGNYMNNLTLLNGAWVTGHAIRVGNFTAAAIEVGGTNASSVAAGIRLVNTANGTRPLTLNVADVTGDADTDLAIPGVINDYPNLTGMPVVKAGDGTVTLSGANTYLGDTTVGAGTLALGANGTLHTNSHVVLDGGTLAMGAFSNALGTLALGNNSLIDLGSGQLAFADSSSNAWTGTLTLTGTLGPQALRFGTDSTGLTGGQLQSITLDGESPGIDADGYLAFGAGTVLLVR